MMSGVFCKERIKLNYLTMGKEELENLRKELKKKYDMIKNTGMQLNISRGKPCREQVNLSMPMLSGQYCGDYTTERGEDCCNYGFLDGIREMKKIFADIMGVATENVFVGGNSSLNMMFDTIAGYMVKGVCDEEPWLKQGNIKFLCPSPGYDRHFAVLEYFGIEAIVIPMTKTGPNMDMVEKLVSEDEKVKGIWCVPKYSNPQGITYSDETVKRFAKLKPKAKDFRIFWDNAYAVHFLSDEDERLLNLYDECVKNGTEDMPIIFTSTSKITIPGAGIAAIAASNNNLNDIKARYKIQTIGYDKVNQLRHVRFLKNYNGVIEHMKKHKSILKPKFDKVIEILEREFSGNKIISFTRPKGGYFISVDVLDGCADKVVGLCKSAGLILTKAGATYPQGQDTKNNNIRIAPTYPKVEELEVAMNLFCICIKLVTIDKLLSLK